MKTTALILTAATIILASGLASAEESGDSSGSDGGYQFGVALTIGEGMYFVDHDVYRGPVSLEVVPSLGWSWFKFDLGLSTTFESVKIAGTNVGDWNFTFRPGGRLTPPMIPVYLRVAFPVRIQTDDIAGGMMFGLGADIPIIWKVGLVLEVDSTLDSALNWGGDGVPLDIRVGASIHF